MKKFECSEDFDLNPDLFHTDLKFLDCEYFLSDHLTREDHYFKNLEKPTL